MKILVVGGAGNLGRGLVRALDLQSHQSLVWDKDKDIHNLTPNVLTKYPIDLIVNLSVIADLKKKEIRINDLDYLVNVIGLYHLVNLSEETGIPLIQISTREVIGVRDFRVVDKMQSSAVELREVSESEPCFPLHSYGKTKLIGEFLMQGCMLGSVIRLNTCYTDEVRNGGGLIANLVRRSRQDSQVTLDNDGLALRDPLHIADLTSLILAIYDKQAFGEIFHASGGAINILSVREICTLANADVKINSGLTNNDYGFVMDIGKAQSLGWNPKTNFRTWITQN